jgi:large subunit ribosomal protein L35
VGGGAASARLGSGALIRAPWAPVHLTIRVFPTILRAPVMPKMKTRKAAAKRFRVTGKGRVRRPKAGGNHGMQEKSRKRLRRLRKNDMVDSTMEKHVKRMLPYG